MIKKLNHFGDSLKLGLAILIGSFFNFKKNKIYLIGERKDQCQDNGYHLFKYIRENYKEEEVYYCITRESKQLDNIKELGNIIYYKSFKHFLYYVMAEKLICAHVASCTPDCAVVWKSEEKGLVNKERVFIQHGITKEVIPSLMRKSSNITTFICGAKKEYDFVRSQFGYDSDDVKYLGFCRFDNLHNYKVKNQILLMPTWRQWFGMDGASEVTGDEFKSSEYFKTYNNLINSESLNKVLNDYDLELIFYPHNEMQRYLNLFGTKFDKVKIADKDDYDVQQLLKESKILITDYSSIAFDFGYMRKPIVYYQFDKDKYDSNHYSKGYFEYERDGFGVVAKNEEDLIKEVENIIKKGIDETYLERVKEFFPIYDDKNCERYYREITGR